MTMEAVCPMETIELFLKTGHPLKEPGFKEVTECNSSRVSRLRSSRGH